MTHQQGTGHGIIAIGAEVYATDEKVGEVSRVIVDADSDLMSQIVVKSGTILSRERVVPLDCVSHGDRGELRLDMDKDAFEQLDGFDPKQYRAPDPDYNGPPGFDAPGMNRSDFQLNNYVAMGSLMGMGQAAKPFGYPGGEITSPGRIERPDVEEGSDVLDSEGEKVGEVAALELSADSGAPSRLVVRQGHIFHDETELPVGWIENLSNKGVVLNVTRAEIEARTS